MAEEPSSSTSSKNPGLDLLRSATSHRHDHVEDGDRTRHQHDSHHSDRQRSPHLSGADHERPSRSSDYWPPEHGRRSPSADSAHSPPRESTSTRGSRSPPRAFKEFKSRQISVGISIHACTALAFNDSLRAFPSAHIGRAGSNTRRIGGRPTEPNPACASMAADAGCPRPQLTMYVGVIILQI